MPDWTKRIWSETFENEVRDVMLLQSEVAQSIAEQVEVTILPLEQAQFKKAGSVNPAAYEAYLKGQFSCRTLHTARHKVGGTVFPAGRGY